MRVVPYMAIAMFMTAQPVAAQMSDEDVLARGRHVMEWIYEVEADSIWNNMLPDAQARVESVDGIYDRMDQVAIQLGDETAVEDEQVYHTELGNEYWRTSSFESAPEPFVWRMVLDDDGNIARVQLGPVSQSPAPPTPNDE